MARCAQCGGRAGFIKGWTVDGGLVCSEQCHELWQAAHSDKSSEREQRLMRAKEAEESETFSNEQANLGTSSFIASVLIFLGWLGLFAAIFLMMYLGDSLSGQGVMSILAVGIVGWAQMVGFGTVINVLYEIKNKL